MEFNFLLFLDWLFFLNSILLIAVIILERRSPEKTIAWFLVFLIIPPLGILLYIFIGRNWKKHKLNNNFSEHTKELIDNFTEKIKRPDFKPLLELLAKNNDSPIFSNNDIVIYNNGEEKFASLKSELLKAEHHIHLEYFIVKDDNIGNEIKDILIRKAGVGVRVIFIIDRVGSDKAKEYFY